MLVKSWTIHTKNGPCIEAEDLSVSLWEECTKRISKKNRNNCRNRSLKEDNLKELALKIWKSLDYDQKQ